MAERIKNPTPAQQARADVIVEFMGGGIAYPLTNGGTHWEPGPITPADIAADEAVAYLEKEARERVASWPAPDVTAILDRCSTDELRRLAEVPLWIAADVGRRVGEFYGSMTERAESAEEDTRGRLPTWLPSMVCDDPTAARWWSEVLGVEADTSILQAEGDREENARRAAHHQA